MRHRPSMLRQARHSGQAIPVVEASAEIGLDGELQFHFRQAPGGRDRSEPPSLGEIIAAFSKYQHVEMTPEQHRAVFELLAACGWPSDRLRTSGRGRRSERQSDGSSSPR